MPPRSNTAAVPAGRKNKKAVTENAFGALLKQVRRDVDTRLSSLFQRKLTEAEPLGADVVALVDALRDLTMRGGKRFRPALLMAAYQAVDEKAPEGIALDAGVALELLQTYLLVHDDWMDRDDVRRGGPSVHAMLAHHHGSRAVGGGGPVFTRRLRGGEGAKRPPFGEGGGGRNGAGEGGVWRG